MTDDIANDGQKLRKSILLPFLFVAFLWIIYIVDISLHLDLGRFGTHPREPDGLIGIITTPLLHKDYEHLISNSIPLILLGSMVAYFYSNVLWRLLTTLYFLSGLWLWMLGLKGENHIGASGIVYALVSFLFFSGILTRHRGMLAISLLTIFLYSSLFLGIIPFLVPKDVSWQGHLAGSLAGIVLAFYFKSEGPKREEYKWEDEDETIPPADDSSADITTSNNPISGITYHFIPKQESRDTDEEKLT